MSEFADCFRQLTAETIQQLAAFMQFKYGGNNEAEAPSPTAMLVTVSGVVVYYVIAIVLLRIPIMRRFAATAQHFLVWSGYAAVSTLAAALLPDRAGPFIYMIFGLLSAGEVLYMLRDNLLIEEEVVEGEASTKFEVYARRARRFLINICRGRLAEAFGMRPEPILPISSMLEFRPN